jgi:hypothetical protein
MCKFTYINGDPFSTARSTHRLSSHREEELSNDAAGMMALSVLATSLTSYHAIFPHHRHGLQIITSNITGGEPSRWCPLLYGSYGKHRERSPQKIISSTALSVVHLLCYSLTTTPDQQQLRIIKAILDEFGRLSSLKINLAKSELLFTTASDNETQRLAQIIGCTAANFPFNYLGLSLSNKKLSKNDFLHLV